MIVPMLGKASFWRGSFVVIERLFWRGRPLPLGIMRLRWLLPASRVGYDYPDKQLPDVLSRPEEGRRAA